MKIINSSAKSILLSLFFVVPFNSIGAQNAQLTRSAQHEKNSIDRIVTRYKELYKRYQKCKAGICTPQEQKQLQQELRTLRNEVLFVGTGLIALIAGGTLAAVYIPRLRKKTKARAAAGKKWNQYNNEDEEKRKLQAELQRGQEIENEKQEKEQKRKEAEDEQARQEKRRLAEEEQKQEEINRQNMSKAKHELIWDKYRQKTEKLDQEYEERRKILNEYNTELIDALSGDLEERHLRRKEIKRKYREKYPTIEFR